MIDDIRMGVYYDGVMMYMMESKISFFGMEIDEVLFVNLVWDV
jgi:hypothetical protein